jgi:hypothetical protein
LFNLLKSIFTKDDTSNLVEELTKQLKETTGRVSLLEKKVSDYEQVLYEHHKTIAAIASIQANLLAEMERAIKTSGTKKTRTVFTHTSSSKGDDFIN